MSKLTRATGGKLGFVFDLDNTLVASHIDFAGMRTAVVGALYAAGVAVSDEQLRWPVGRLADLALKEGLPADLHTRVWQVIEKYEVEGMANATLEEGAREVTSALRQAGYPLAIVTNNSRASAIEVLKKLDLMTPFQAILGREDVACLKPAPDGVLAAAASMGRPQRVVVIGDAWLDGVAAHAAGALFVAVGSFRQGPIACPVWAQIEGLLDLLIVDWELI